MENIKKTVIFYIYFLFSVSALSAMHDSNSDSTYDQNSDSTYDSNEEDLSVEKDIKNFKPYKKIKTEPIDLNNTEPIDLKNAQEIWNDCKNSFGNNSIEKTLPQHNKIEYKHEIFFSEIPLNNTINTHASLSIKIENNSIKQEPQLIKNNNHFLNFLMNLKTNCKQCGHFITYDEKNIHQFFVNNKDINKQININKKTFSEKIKQHFTNITQLSICHKYRYHDLIFYAELEKNIVNNADYDSDKEEYKIQCVMCNDILFAKNKERLTSYLLYHLKFSKHNKEEYETIQKNIIQENRTQLIEYAKINKEYKNELLQIHLKKKKSEKK